MSVTLKQMEALVWVADLRSFKGAADRLNTTQPNISARIASIENTVGEDLFDRYGRSLDLTAKGHELVEAARDVLRSRDAFLALAKDAHLTKSRLRLGVTEMVVHTWLRDFMLALKTEFPNVLVELTVDMASELDRALAAHQLDIAFMNGPFGFQTNGVSLGTFELVWVAAPKLNLPSNANLQDLAALAPQLTLARTKKSGSSTSSHAHRVPPPG